MKQPEYSGPFAFVCLCAWWFFFQRGFLRLILRLNLIIYAYRKSGIIAGPINTDMRGLRIVYYFHDDNTTMHGSYLRWCTLADGDTRNGQWDYERKTTGDTSNESRANINKHGWTDKKLNIIIHFFLFKSNKCEYSSLYDVRNVA